MELPFVTHCASIPKLKFDVAVQLNNQPLDVDCKCVVVKRNPLRIYVREHGMSTVLKDDFTQQLIQHQPLDTVMRTLMEEHLFNTLITRSPVDIDTQMNGLSKFVTAANVYHHRFTSKQHDVPPNVADLAATIAYAANGQYNNAQKVFSGSVSHWRKRIASHHLPCASLVAIAVALTPTHDLPSHTLQQII